MVNIMNKIPKYSCGSDDITFCANECSNEHCFRNTINMINKYTEHYKSSFFKDTVYCPLYILCKEKE